MQTRSILRFAVAALAIVLLLSACGPSAQAPATQAPPVTQPTQPAPVQPTAAPAQPTSAPAAQGGVVTVLMPGGRPETDFVKSQIADFKKETGIDAKVSELGTEDENTRLATEFKAGASSFDVVGMPYEWVPQFYPNLVAIDDKFTADDKSDILKSAMDAASMNGHVYGILYTITCNIFFYRTDLLAAANLQVPTTWDEYVAAAQKLTTKDVWGAPVVAQNSDEPVVTFLGYLYQAGGDVLDKDGKVIINQKPGVEALTFLVDLVQKYKVAPPGAANMNTVDVTNLFKEGKMAMAPNWTYMYAIADAKDSKVAGKFAMTTVPGKVNKAVPIGGWILSISKFSKDPDAAYKFIHFMTDTARQKVAAIQFGNTPFRYSTSKDPEVSKLPYVPPMIKALETAVPRMKNPAWAKIATIIGAELSAAVSGSVTPQAAMDDAAAKIAEALKSQ